MSVCHNGFPDMLALIFSMFRIEFGSISKLIFKVSYNAIYYLK